MRVALVSIAWNTGFSSPGNCNDAQHLVCRRLSLRGLAQLALRLREAAFEISRMFLPHRGRPMPSRLDAEGLKFYATLGSPSMVQVFRFYSITSSARASR